MFFVCNRPFPAHKYCTVLHFCSLQGSFAQQLGETQLGVVVPRVLGWKLLMETVENESDTAAHTRDEAHILLTANDKVLVSSDTRQSQFRKAYAYLRSPRKNKGLVCME